MEAISLSLSLSLSRSLSLSLSHAHTFTTLYVRSFKRQSIALRQAVIRLFVPEYGNSVRHVSLYVVEKRYQS